MARPVSCNAAGVGPVGVSRSQLVWTRCMTRVSNCDGAPLCVKPAFFLPSRCLSPQGLARHDAVDPVAAARGERHQHHHC